MAVPSISFCLPSLQRMRISGTHMPANTYANDRIHLKCLDNKTFLSIAQQLSKFSISSQECFEGLGNATGDSRTSTAYRRSSSLPAFFSKA